MAVKTRGRKAGKSGKKSSGRGTVGPAAAGRDNRSQRSQRSQAGGRAPRRQAAAKPAAAGKRSRPAGKRPAKRPGAKSGRTAGASRPAPPAGPASSTGSTAPPAPPVTPASPPAGAAAGARKVEHVVVLMLENRSFDHIFGFRPGVEGLKGNESNLLDPTKPESDTNPAFFVSNGAPYQVLAGEGPSHSINGSNLQLCNWKDGPDAQHPMLNNGFVHSYNNELVLADKVPNPGQPVIRVVMEGFPPSQLPSINALADNFCICDHWFSEVPGPTQPNRLYMHAATSAGYAHNVWSQQFAVPTIYNRLQDAGCTWATYEFDQNEVREFTMVSSQSQNFKDFAAFAVDTKQGTLANYSFILPRFLNSNTGDMANSQHAPEDARYGDNLVADVYDALRANEELWANSVLIVIYDEHGGFYDHVIPPFADIPNPDGINSPVAGDVSYAPQFAFDRLGFRVPAVIASPWVKAGRVDSTRYQHTSVLATLKNLFGLASFLTKRDASAFSFDHLFSEVAEPRTDTPLTLPRAPLPVVTAPATSAHNPANHPLDAVQKDIVSGVHGLTAAAHPEGPPVEDLPEHQGDASDFIKARFTKQFGPRGAAGKVPRPTAARRPRAASKK